MGDSNFQVLLDSLKAEQQLECPGYRGHFWPILEITERITHQWRLRNALCRRKLFCSDSALALNRIRLERVVWCHLSNLFRVQVCHCVNRHQASRLALHRFAAPSRTGSPLQDLSLS